MKSMHLLPTLTVLLALCASVHGEDPVIATFQGGQVTMSEFEQWSAAHQFKLPEQNGSALAGLVAAKHIATKGKDVPRHIDFQVDLKAKQFAFKVLRPQVESEVKFDLAALEAQVQRNLAFKDRPRRIRLRNLFIRFAPQAEDAEKKKARELMASLVARLQQGEDFGAIAMQYSNSQSRFNQGILGNVRPGQLPAQLEQEVWQLQAGELSRIFESKDGLTLFKCDRHFAAEPRSEADFRSSYVSSFKERKKRKAWQDFQDQLYEKANVLTSWDRLKAPMDAVLCEYQNGSLTVGDYRALLRANDVSFLEKPPMRVAVLKGHIIGKLAIEELKAQPKYSNQLKQAHPWWRLRALLDWELKQRMEQSQSEPNEEKLKELYQRFGERLKEPATYKLQVLRRSFEKTDRQKTYALMEGVLHDLNQGNKSFAESAKSYSDHDSAASGGHLGWVSDLDLPKIGINLVRAARFHQPGALTGLIEESERFLWLMKILDKKPERLLSYEEARPQLIRRLQGFQKGRQADVVFAQMLNETQIKVVSAYASLFDIPIAK